MVQAQQAYTTVLSGHIAALHTKLAHLDKQIQMQIGGSIIHYITVDGLKHISQRK